MKSIKPGRGPSLMSGIMGIAAAVFGVIWIIGAISLTSDASWIGGPAVSIGAIFPLFGVLFVIIAILSAAYHFRNAVGKKRYSAYDIVDGQEEPDPLNEQFSQETSETRHSGFCPSCGAAVQESHRFCAACGKALEK